MYSNTNVHVQIYVISPKAPHKVYLRCSCGWKHYNKYSIKYNNPVPQESFWTFAKKFAEEPKSIYKNEDQKDRVLRWAKEEHSQITMNDTLYHDAVKMCKEIT